MTNRRAMRSFAALLCTVALSAQTWEQDLERAKAKANEQGKLLLLLFAGPEGCVRTKRFETEILSHPDFRAEAERTLVFVRAPSLFGDQEVLAAARSLALSHAVESAPTLALADASGRPLANTGPMPLPPSLFLRHLDALRVAAQAREEAFALVRARPPAERLRAVEQFAGNGFESLSTWNWIQRLHADFFAELLQSPEMAPEDVKRWREQEIFTKTQTATALLQMEITPFAEQGRWDEFERRIDASIELHRNLPSFRQEALYYRAIAAIDGRKDMAAGLVLLGQALNADPQPSSEQRWWGKFEMIARALDSLGKQAQVKSNASDQAPSSGK